MKESNQTIAKGLIETSLKKKFESLIIATLRTDLGTKFDRYAPNNVTGNLVGPVFEHLEKYIQGTIKKIQEQIIKSYVPSGQPEEETTKVKEHAELQLQAIFTNFDSQHQAKIQTAVTEQVIKPLKLTEINTANTLIAIQIEQSFKTQVEDQLKTKYPSYADPSKVPQEEFDNTVKIILEKLTEYRKDTIAEIQAQLKLTLLRGLDSKQQLDENYIQKILPNAINQRKLAIKKHIDDILPEAVFAAKTIEANANKAKANVFLEKEINKVFKDVIAFNLTQLFPAYTVGGEGSSRTKYFINQIFADLASYRQVVIAELQRLLVNTAPDQDFFDGFSQQLQIELQGKINKAAVFTNNPIIDGSIRTIVEKLEVAEDATNKSLIRADISEQIEQKFNNLAENLLIEHYKTLYPNGLTEKDKISEAQYSYTLEKIKENLAVYQQQTINTVLTTIIGKQEYRYGYDVYEIQSSLDALIEDTKFNPQHTKELLKIISTTVAALNSSPGLSKADFFEEFYKQSIDPKHKPVRDLLAADDDLADDFEEECYLEYLSIIGQANSVPKLNVILPTLIDKKFAEFATNRLGIQSDIKHKLNVQIGNRVSGNFYYKQCGPHAELATDIVSKVTEKLKTQAENLYKVDNLLGDQKFLELIDIEIDAYFRNQENKTVVIKAITDHRKAFDDSVNEIIAKALQESNEPLARWEEVKEDLTFYLKQQVEGLYKRIPVGVAEQSKRYRAIQDKIASALPGYFAKPNRTLQKAQSESQQVQIIFKIKQFLPADQNVIALVDSSIQKFFSKSPYAFLLTEVREYFFTAINNEEDFYKSLLKLIPGELNAILQGNQLSTDAIKALTASDAADIIQTRVASEAGNFCLHENKQLTIRAAETLDNYFTVLVEQSIEPKLATAQVDEKYKNDLFAYIKAIWYKESNSNEIFMGILSKKFNLEYNKLAPDQRVASIIKDDCILFYNDNKRAYDDRCDEIIKNFSQLMVSIKNLCDKLILTGNNNNEIADKKSQILHAVIKECAKEGISATDIQTQQNLVNEYTHIVEVVRPIIHTAVKAHPYIIPIHRIDTKKNFLYNTASTALNICVANASELYKQKDNSADLTTKVAGHVETAFVAQFEKEINKIFNEYTKYLREEKNKIITKRDNKLKACLAYAENNFTSEQDESKKDYIDYTWNAILSQYQEDLERIDAKWQAQSGIKEKFDETKNLAFADRITALEHYFGTMDGFTNLAALKGHRSFWLGEVFSVVGLKSKGEKMVVKPMLTVLNNYKTCAAQVAAAAKSQQISANNNGQSHVGLAPTNHLRQSQSQQVS